MASVLDQALDEIVASKTGPRGGNGGRSRGRRGGGGGDRSSAPRDGPRDGISKPPRSMRDPGRNTWQHDKFDEPDAPSYNRRERVDRGVTSQGSARLRVENVHYELGESDLMEVFSRVGRVLRLDMQYDRAGRSEGVATVTYANEDEARIAVSQFDGANANGQPIRVKFMPGGGRNEGRGGRGGGPGNDRGSLFDRVGGGRDGMDEDGDRAAGDGRRQRRNADELRENAQHLKIDRYVPGDRRSTSRDRRPRGGMGGERERDRGGRGRGGRDDRRGGRGGERGERGGGGSNRPRKTAEELDAEMNNYWGSAEEQAPVVTVGGVDPSGAASNPQITVGGGPSNASGPDPVTGYDPSFDVMD